MASVQGDNYSDLDFFFSVLKKDDYRDMVRDLQHPRWPPE